MNLFGKNPIKKEALHEATSLFERQRSEVNAYDSLILAEIERASERIKKINDDNLVLGEVCYDALRHQDRGAMDDAARACHIGGLLKALRGRVIKNVVYENVRSMENPASSIGTIRVILEPKVKEEEAE